MSEEKEFEIRTYGFCELALLYFPDLMKKSASNNLSRWIYNSERLLQELRSAEWKERTKLLTPRQVEIITNHFGKP